MTAPPPTRTAARAAQVEEARERRARAGPITASMRRAVIGKRKVCPECKREVKLTFDHRRPVRFGGQSTVENGGPLCQSCNSSKGDGTRGEAQTCARCGNPFRHITCPKYYREITSGVGNKVIRERPVLLCARCRKWLSARSRKLGETKVRKAASEAKRVRERAYRQASRRAQRRRERA